MQLLLHCMKFFLYLVLSISYFVCFSQANPFLGNWVASAKYEKPDDPTSLVKWDREDDIDWLISVDSDSLGWYINGTLMFKLPYELGQSFLSLQEGVTFSLLENEKAQLKDSTGKFNVIFEIATPVKFEQTPSELFEVWEVYGRYFLDDSNDTTRYSIQGSDDFTSIILAFNEQGDSYQFFRGGAEYYKSKVKYRNDTLFYVKPYSVGTETYYVVNNYFPVHQLDEISFVYRELNPFGDILNKYIKTFDRTKSSWSEPPKEILGKWIGTHKYRIEFGDTIRTTKEFGLLGVEVGSRKLETTHNAEYEFLTNNRLLYSWNGESDPVEFLYEIKDDVLIIYKFPILAGGKEKFLGIEKYPIDVLKDSLLSIRSKVGTKYDSKSFSKE